MEYNDSGQHVSEKKKVPRKETDWKTNTGHTIKDESWKIEKGQQSGELIADCWGMPNVFLEMKLMIRKRSSSY